MPPSVMMVLVSQSNYLPWRGFIDLIRNADIFVVYDSMQFTKNDWRNRNLITNNGKVQWLTVPCGSSISRTIDQVYPASLGWNKRHFETIRHCYARYNNWAEHSQQLKDLYDSFDGMSLSEVNVSLLQYILRFEGISTKLVRDCEIVEREKLSVMEKTERLVEICQCLGATKYISGPSAKNYLNESLFAKNCIDVTFYDYPSYEPVGPLPAGQLYNLSWLDTLMRRGHLF